MDTESAKDMVKVASSNLFSRILIAITLLLLVGVFMALGACSSSENKTTFTAGGPGSPSAASGDGVVTLSWSAVTGAASYKLYWNTTGRVSTADVSIPVTGVTYTHTGLINGVSYYYRISALTGGGVESPLSDETSATPRQSKPATPSGLSAVTSSGQVALAWQASARATAYKLYWNTTGGVTSADQRVEVPKLSYTHTGLTNGTTYRYRVSAINDAGESELSGEISATPGGGGGGGGGGSGSAYNSEEFYEFPTAGKADWSVGVVTFSITGLAFDMLPRGKDYFLFMAKFVTPNGNEGNFQMNIADLTPRLISQRFDGTCPRFCEQQNIGDINWLINEVYSFRFDWNSSTVTCVIKDSGGNIMFDGFVNTWGTFAGVSFVRVGNGVLPPYLGVGYPITVIAPTMQ
jgi:hypothetical protein